MGDIGVQTIFEKDTCKMVRGEMVLMRGVRNGTLYKLLGSNATGECNSSTIRVKENGSASLPEKNSYALASIDGTHRGEKLSTFSHQRYGRKFSRFLIRVRLLWELCVRLIELVRFSLSVTREKGILELIHSYVFGLVHVPSLGGS